jgi:hypothetical protein
MYIEIPTAASNCSRGGNGYHCNTARQRQRRHQAKRNDGTAGDKGTTRRQANSEKEAKQTKKKAQETSNDVSWAIGKFF